MPMKWPKWFVKYGTTYREKTPLPALSLPAILKQLAGNSQKPSAKDGRAEGKMPDWVIIREVSYLTIRIICYGFDREIIFYQIGIL